jgi:UDP-N-acetylmuramyl pentapeptide phosphotransferase/UDP-N-acetylglucosamine-1-phosphate transferase
MFYLVCSFSLLVAISGWFYLFYSKAAENLAGIEQHRINRRRIRLRRLGGSAMFLLAIAFFAGVRSVDHENSPHAFIAIWFAVILLLAIIVLLGLLDLRLTWKLKK